MKILVDDVGTMFIAQSDDCIGTSDSKGIIGTSAREFIESSTEKEPKRSISTLLARAAADRQLKTPVK